MEYTAHQKRENALDCTLRNALLPLILFSMFLVRHRNRMMSTMAQASDDQDAAGMAAALPGVIAASTPLPVIGVPIKGMLDGLDAMLSIIQMPPGIPVATVGVNAAQNAAILAAEMIALCDEEVAQKVEAWKAGLGAKIEKANQDLAEVKYDFPGRAAAIPAAAMITFTPRSLAPLANDSTASGVRCAERAFTSKGIWLSFNHLHAFSITGRSLVLPMIMLTNGFISFYIICY